MKLLVLDMQTSPADIFVVATAPKTPGELISSSAASSATAVSPVTAVHLQHLADI